MIVFKYPGDAADRTTSSGWSACRARRSASSTATSVSRRRGEAAIRDRPQAAGEAAGHAPAGVRQRLHAADRRRDGWPPRWRLSAERRQHGRRRGCRRRRPARSTPTAAADRRHGFAISTRVPTLRPVADAACGGRLPPTDTIAAAVDHRLHRLQHAARESPAMPADRRRRPAASGCTGSATWRCECTVDVDADSGELLFELRQGRPAVPVPHRRGHGQATLRSAAHDEFRPARRRPACAGRASTRCSSPTATTNCGCGSTAAGRLRRLRRGDVLRRLGNNDPTRDDLAPAGIGARGAAVHGRATCTIRRDIYYIADRTDGPPRAARRMTLADRAARSPLTADAQARRSSAVEQAAARYRQPRLSRSTPTSSSCSATTAPRARTAGCGAARRTIFLRRCRELLIGKALFIYWPHSWDTPIAFWPNLSRMGFVARNRLNIWRMKSVQLAICRSMRWQRFAVTEARTAIRSHHSLSR